jgi:hypothetical protein
MQGNARCHHLSVCPSKQEVMDVMGLEHIKENIVLSPYLFYLTWKVMLSR